MNQSLDLHEGIELVDQPLAHLRIGTELCSGEVYLQGAHITSFVPAGHRDVLWMSPRSAFATGEPIRGGIPVCWPWFGNGRDGNAPVKHGFARTNTWQLRTVEKDDEGVVRVTLGLTPADVVDLMGYPDDFDLELVAEFGRELRVALTSRANATPLAVEEALHTYLAVGDVRQVWISGLEGAEYTDRRKGACIPGRTEGEVRFTEELDSIFDSSATTVLHDPIVDRQVMVRKEASRSTVVWNPWDELAATMSDIGPDVWTQYCCIETANCVERTVTLMPGEHHTMAVVLRSTEGE